MFEPRPFSDKSNAQDDLIVALKNRDLLAFEEALADPDVDPDYWYGKPYWSTCLQLAAKTEGCEAFVLALLRAGAGSPAASHPRQRPSTKTLRKLSGDLLQVNGQVDFGHSPRLCVCGAQGGAAGSGGVTVEQAAGASDEQKTVLFWLRDLGRAVRKMSEFVGAEMRALSDRMEQVEGRLEVIELTQQRTNELLRQQNLR